MKISKAQQYTFRSRNLGLWSRCIGVPKNTEIFVNMSDLDLRSLPNNGISVFFGFQCTEIKDRDYEILKESSADTLKNPCLFPIFILNTTFPRSKFNYPSPPTHKLNKKIEIFSSRSPLRRNLMLFYSHFSTRFSHIKEWHFSAQRHSNVKEFGGKMGKIWSKLIWKMIRVNIKWIFENYHKMKFA